MGVEKKAKPATAVVAQVEAETHDEIAEIMGEIEGLQQELAEAPVKPSVALQSKPALKAVPKIPATPMKASEPEAAAPVVAAEETPVDETQDPSLEDIRAGASGDSIEETLGGLEDEPPAPGSILSTITSVEEEESQQSVEEVQALADESVEAELAPEMSEDQFETETTQAVAEPPAKPARRAPAPVAKLSESRKAKGAKPAPSAGPSAGVSAGVSDGTLTMTLTGNMKLNLRYECDGNEVSVGFEDGFLKIEMAGGTELKVPVKKVA